MVHMKRFSYVFPQGTRESSDNPKGKHESFTVKTVFSLKVLCHLHIVSRDRSRFDWSSRRSFT